MLHDHGHFEHLLHSVDAIDAALVVSIAWFSFLMSWHCAGMCGPLACAKFSRQDSTAANSFLYIALYNFGRIVSYAVMGAVIGSLSETVTEMLPGVGRVLASLLAVAIAVNGVMLVFGRELSWSSQFLAKITRRVSLFAASIGGVTSSFLFGLMTVFLPCMTLASALAAAAMTEDVVSGGLVMLGFALGTVPVMFLMPMLADAFTNGVIGNLPVQWLRRLAGVLLIAVSVITSLRMFH